MKGHYICQFSKSKRDKTQKAMKTGIKGEVFKMRGKQLNRKKSRRFGTTKCAYGKSSGRRLNIVMGAV